MLGTSKAQSSSNSNFRLLPAPKAPIRVSKSDFEPFCCCFPASPSKEKVALQELFNVIYATAPIIHNKAAQARIQTAVEKTIENLLSLGCHIDSKNGLGVTPLIAAAGLEHLIAVRALLAAGANVNARSDKNKTALLKAVNNLCTPTTSQNVLAVVNELLKYKPDLSVKSHKGKSALLTALMRTYTRNPPKEEVVVIKALLEAGAPIDASVLNYLKEEPAEEVSKLINARLTITQFNSIEIDSP